MKTNVLRKIVFLRKIWNNLKFLTPLIVLMIPTVLMTTLTPPIRSKLFSVLAVSLLLLISTFLRGKFILSFSRKLSDSNLVYFYLYFSFFFIELGYIPKIIYIYPESNINYFIIAFGIILCNNLGDLFLRKIKKIYWKYKILIEKGKKYNDIEQTLK